MVGEHNLFPRTLSLAVHELRTPVTVVAGYLRMLLKEQAGPLSEKQRKMLEEAERSCGRIGALVAEMSDLGKLESGELGLSRQSFDLTALVAELASGMHENSDRDVHVEVRGAEQPLEVLGDRARLGTALRALLYAAVRERSGPGVVVARCSSVDGATPAAIVAIGDETTVNALAEAAVAAEPFDEWRGGLGLALPVARRIVEAHGGALWSAPGEKPRAGSALRIPLKAR